MKSEMDLLGAFEILIASIAGYFLGDIINVMPEMFSIDMPPEFLLILKIGVFIMLVWILWILHFKIFKRIRDRRKKK